MVRTAHAAKNDDLLRKAYGFANWCRTQQAEDLWNAAGVSFYEHLFDAWSDRELILPWLSPEALRDSMPLWQARLNPAQLAELRELIDNRTEHRWREYSTDVQSA